MWRLTSIYAQNLCAFKELDYQLNQNRTTLVFGNNMDNASQLSNGSGKSALIEAIAIGLTGTTLRDIKMEEVINDAYDNAQIKLSLTNDSTGIIMDIERELSRKNPQSIHVYFTENGERNEDVQPSVNDYNKFILDTIGLSRDDIFANFILSKHKYHSFLSSTDREKKEIINRFSNGIIVDESIAALQADMEPIKDDLQAAERNVATCQGRVSALEEQIANALNESAERSKTKAKRIEEWNQAIVEKRAYIREQNTLIDKSNEILDGLDEVYEKLRQLEDGESGFEKEYAAVKKLLTECKLEGFNDYEAHIEQLQADLQRKEKQQESITQDVTRRKQEVDDEKKKFESLKKEHEQYEGLFQSKYDEVTGRINELLAKIKKIEAENDKLTQKRNIIQRAISTIKGQLAGVITCPKCKHEFTLNQGEDVKALRTQLEKNEKEIEEVRTTISDNNAEIEDITVQGRDVRKEQTSMNAERSQWSQKITDAQANVDQLIRSLSSQSRELDAIKDAIAVLQKKIDSTRNSMFDEAFEIIDDAIKKHEATVKQCKTNADNALGAISSYEESIKDIEKASETDVIASLKTSKEKYEKDLTLAISKQEEIQRNLSEYQKQEATFVEFKTHLANTKIEALSHITNEFLEAIGSDIRIAFSGYTVLKSGKVRDKISISLIRDGIDGGSFNKYSEGEKSRVNLANILAMHKLTNVNCNEGKGLDLLILDEILDACDEGGLSNMFQALNQLKITSLVVSHGNIAENYPYKLVVNKQNGISFI